MQWLERVRGGRGINGIPEVVVILSSSLLVGVFERCVVMRVAMMTNRYAPGLMSRR